jgi:hypothetical protein
MFKSSQLTRPAVIAATVISLGASPAIARQADMPVRPKAAVTTVARDTRQWTQPRVDSMGVRPADLPVVPTAPAVPLTQDHGTSGGAEWLLIAIAASAMLAALMIVTVVRAVRHRAHALRARQV